MVKDQGLSLASLSLCVSVRGSKRVISRKILQDRLFSLENDSARTPTGIALVREVVAP